MEPNKASSGIELKSLINCFEEAAPHSLQESYDNSGLLIGSPETKVQKALISLDLTDAVMEEAINKSCDVIISHHPIIFKGIKRLTNKTLVERLIVKAIKNDIAIYAIHTNLDNVVDGVNGKIAEKLGLVKTRVLLEKEVPFKKLVTFCPKNHAEQVREAMFQGGGGHIGNYSHCSFNISGQGSFKALEGSNPFVGKEGQTHFEDEVRIETIVPQYQLQATVSAMLKAHPYEEVAYDIYPIENTSRKLGAGMIGELKEDLGITEFLQQLKEVFNIQVLKHNQLIEKPVRKIAFCGGSGSFLIANAFRAEADVFITGDIKYHDYFEYRGAMTIVDAGHYETEQFTKELIHTLLMKKFPNFALQISDTESNPVSFL